jgi:hypothetical protein
MGYEDSIFSNIMPCGSLKVNRRLEETLPPSSASKRKPRKKQSTCYREFEVFTAVVIFWHMTPCSPLSVNRLISSTLKMEAICSSETSVDTTDYTAPYPRRCYSSVHLLPAS